jgi:hypothetical protein
MHEIKHNIAKNIKCQTTNKKLLRINWVCHCWFLSISSCCSDFAKWINQWCYLLEALPCLRFCRARQQLRLPSPASRVPRACCGSSDLGAPTRMGRGHGWISAASPCCWPVRSDLPQLRGSLSPLRQRNSSDPPRASSSKLLRRARQALVPPHAARRPWSRTRPAARAYLLAVPGLALAYCYSLPATRHSLRPGSSPARRAARARAGVGRKKLGWEGRRVQARVNGSVGGGGIRYRWFGCWVGWCVGLVGCTMLFSTLDVVCVYIYIYIYITWLFTTLCGE